jgi:hypothetical protein
LVITALSANFRYVIELVMSLIITGILLPYGLIYMANSGIISVTINGTAYTLADAEPVLSTMLEVIIPLMASIGVTAYYVPRFKST